MQFPLEETGIELSLIAKSYGLDISPSEALFLWGRYCGEFGARFVYTDGLEKETIYNILKNYH